MTPLSLALAAFLSYLLGSLSFAVIVSRVMGLSDPRDYGSGNPGATNVLRSGHKGAAALTLLLDGVKGAVPVWCVQHVWGAPDAAALVGVAAFLGHLWPVFFRFQGGKGVATACGVLLAFNPLLGLLILAIWLLVVWATRYSSLGALVAGASAPLVQLAGWGASWAAGLMGVMALLLVWRHHGNIQKLWAGTESKVGRKPTPLV
jgi:acyl phosphate:glycerol-3-phosphate acyltransferase